jgi:hypothetical protein
LPTTTDGALGETVIDERVTVVGGGVEGLEERPLLPPPHPVRAVSNITTAASANLVLVLMYNLPYFIPLWGSVPIWARGERRVHVLFPVRYITQVTCK